MSLFYSKDCSPDLIGHVGYLSNPHKTRSHIGYVFIWGGTAISWRYTKQSIIATSSNHAEIITIHEASREYVWLRPGLLSEVCAVFADLHWNVVNTAIWTRNARAAAVVHVVDDITDCAIEDPKRLATIKKLLRNVLYGNNDLKTAQMTLSSPGFTHRERKLHQIMFADRDYIKVRRVEQGKVEDLKSGPLCGLSRSCSHREMEAYQGPELELCTEDRLGLLSDITRIFRENSLCAERAEISIEGGKPKVIFYVTDVTGNPMDQKTVDSIREQVGPNMLHVK
ncbi:ACT domain-containing protein ACR5 [Capsicum chinense]|nr:ACT domain-containing protein ACR5 [Capsicum chinense]